MANMNIKSIRYYLSGNANVLIYFILGCIRSSLLHVGILLCRERGCSLVEGCGFPTAVFSFVAEPMLSALGPQ